MSRLHGEAAPITLTQLRAFRQVAEAGSFSEAALELSVAQSSVSRSVDGLERRLGAVLFERGAQGATLTAAGEAIASDVRHALGLIDRLEGSVATSSLRGDVVVGAFRSAAEQLLPDVLARVRHAHPGVKLRVRTIAEVDGAIGRAVATGYVDIGITSLPVASNLIARRLFADPFVRVEPRDGGGEELPFLLWDEDCSHKAVAWLERVGVDQRAAIELSDDRAVLAHVARGLGYSVMPALSTQPSVASIRTVPLGDGPRRQVAVCTSPGAALRAEVRAVLDMVSIHAGAIADAHIAAAEATAADAEPVQLAAVRSDP